MANEDVQQLRPRDFFRESTAGTDAALSATPTGDMHGLSLPKLDSQGYTTWFTVDAALTVGTGLTFSLPVVDDGTNSDDLGKVVRLGITVKKLVSGSDTADLDTAAATESTVDVTLDATSGEITVGSKAIANAALDSVGAGDTAMLRIRRLGTNANDTCKGRIILLGVAIKNT